MTTGRWANAPVGEQAGQEGALGTMHGKSRILATKGGCMLSTGEAVSILFGTLFAGAASTCCCLPQVEFGRMWERERGQGEASEGLSRLCVWEGEVVFSVPYKVKPTCNL